MNRDEFKQLFEAALETSAENAEGQLGRRIPRNFKVKLFGAGSDGGIFDLDDVVDMMYLGEDRFFRIVDVAVIEVGSEQTTVFVRISGHKPASFKETWNDPPGSGPFKQLLAGEIKTIPDE